MYLCIPVLCSVVDQVNFGLFVQVYWTLHHSVDFTTCNCGGFFLMNQFVRPVDKLANALTDKVVSSSSPFQ